MPSAPAPLIEAGAPSFAVVGTDALGLSSPPTDLHLLPDGRLMVVADQEFALGDGVRWEIMRAAPTEATLPILGVAVDADGSIYTGMAQGFARIEFGEAGTWRRIFAAPWPKTEPTDRRVSRDVVQVGEQWYWHSISGSLMRWRPGQEAKTIKSMGTVETVFRFGDRTYLCDRSDGSLWGIDAGSDQPAMVMEATNSDVAISCTAEFDREHLLVGTHNRGLHLFDGRAMQPFPASKILAGGRRINDLRAIAHGYFAAAVDGYGVAFFDRTGRVVQTLSRTLDPRLARPLRLIAMPDGTLWVLLNEGLARAEFPARISHFEPLIPTGLTTCFPHRHEGKLWVAADGKIHRGIYDEEGRLERFETDSPPERFIFSFTTVTGVPLAGTDLGWYRWDEGEWSLACPHLVNPRLLASQPVDGKWLYAARHEIGWLRAEGGKYVTEGVAMPALRDVYGWIKDDAGDVWLELGSRALGRLRLRPSGLEVEQYGPDDGIADGWGQAFLLDGAARFNVADRIYRFDESARRFVPDETFGRRFADIKSVTGRPGRDALGRWWIAADGNVQVFDDSTGSVRNLHEPMPQSFLPYYLTFEDAGVVWLHRARRLVRFDPSIPLPPRPPLRALVTRVSLIGSDRSAYPSHGGITPFAYRNNSLAFHFAAPGSKLGEPVTFEVLLEGSANDWVPTGTAGSAVFNELKDGHYVLHVRPRAGGETGEEATVTFTVLAPWYRTTTAFAVYALGAALVISLVAWLPSYWQRREKLRLERLVAARTSELHAANLELGRQILETQAKADALRRSEERYRKLSTELEQRVEQRTAELHQANDRLLDSNRELEAFSYSVSHDLRAPLRNISGFADLLRKRTAGRLEAEADRFLAIVSSESVRLGQLIDSLLVFSRLSRAQIKRQRVDLTQLIQAARAELAPDVNGRTIEWRIGALPAAYGDATLLRQVFANLLSNALKFTRQRDVAIIDVSARRVHSPAGGPELEVWVRDNGAGFDPKFSEKLFGVFQRLHHTRDFEGSGIGLATVRRIVGRHGGRTWAEGAPNQGSTFFFTLPDEPPPPEAAPGHDD